jgi:hypothetical protein
MVDNTSARLGFLSLSPEIRNMIYRLVFCALNPICTDEREPLNAQFLRTCKLVQAEGAPILYAENIFTIRLTNTAGPYYMSDYYSRALGRLFGQSNKPCSPAARKHLRRFIMQIRYTDEHKLELIREKVRLFAACLRDLPGPIEYLRLECKLDCGDTSDANRRDPCWGQYEVDGDEEECVGVLRTWLGRLHVIHGEIEGMPEGDAETLRARWRGEGGKEELLGRMERYWALEGGVGGWMFCKEELHEALVCFEADEEAGFNELKEGICKDLRDQVESWTRSGLLEGVTLAPREEA